MKKTFSIMLLITLAFSFAGTSDLKAASVEFKEIETFFEEYSQVEATWKDGKLKRGEDLYGQNDEKIGYLYRIFNKNVQQGYILYLDDLGIVEATFECEDLASNIIGKVYYILPGRFLSKTDYYDIIDVSAFEHEDEIIENKYIDSIYTRSLSTGQLTTGAPHDPSTLQYWAYFYEVITPDVMDLSSNFASYSMSTSAKFYINSIPDYHNYPYGPISNGCIPTSAAMLIAYYDNEEYNDFTEIEGPEWSQDFPLDHADNRDLVDELIIEMSDYLGNCIDYSTGLSLEHCECHPIPSSTASAGISNFLDDAGHDEWDAISGYFDTSTSQYQQLINLGNPSIISIKNHPIYNPAGVCHAVLGMGYYYIYMSQPGAIVHDDWSSTSREIWLSYDVCAYFTFLYND